MIFVVNGLWIALTSFLIWLWPELGTFTVFIALASITGRIEEIGDHSGRGEMTWLPKWFYEKKSKRIVDGYHISRQAYAEFYLLAGIEVCKVAIAAGYNPHLLYLSMYVGVWIYKGFTDNLFYHVNYMKPEHREYYRILFDFVNLIKGFIGWLLGIKEWRFGMEKVYGDKQTVVEAIIDEREYQDAKRGNIEERNNSLADWLLILERELNEAKDAWGNDVECLDELRQVAATAFAALEQHGVVKRSQKAWLALGGPPASNQNGGA